jgi:dihydrofolate reductase
VDIPKLKEKPEGEILVTGSGQLVRGLLAAGLAEEYRLMVFPVILGTGKKLFGDEHASLTLAESRPIGTDGIYLHVYRPRG